MPDQCGEHADGRFAGRQPDVTLRLEQQLGDHKVGSRAAHLVVGVVNTDVHGHVPPSLSLDDLEFESIIAGRRRKSKRGNGSCDKRCGIVSKGTAQGMRMQLYFVMML